LVSTYAPKELQGKERWGPASKEVAGKCLQLPKHLKRKKGECIIVELAVLFEKGGPIKSEKHLYTKQKKLEMAVGPPKGSRKKKKVLGKKIPDLPQET